MTLRHTLSALLALAALLGAGCGRGDNLAYSAEADDPLYQQGQQLKKLNRASEALNAFLKVIEKRGEQGAPESNLEVAIIYDQQIKDPIEAIHYFRKFLDLEPNSQQAPFVRQRVETARRELFRSMPGGPKDDQAVRLGAQGSDGVDRLLRKVEEQEAEIARLRGSAYASGPVKTVRGTVDGASLADVPVVTPRQTMRAGIVTPDFSAPNIVPQPAPSTGGQATVPRVTPSTSGRPAAGAGVVGPPTRPGASQSVVGKRHTVSAGETLFAISKKYKVSPEAIAAVNKEALPRGVNTPLHPGVELKIP